MNDEGLDLSALLAGDRNEFDRLVRRETPRLFKVLVRYVRDEDEARSIMQETFLQAYERLSSFRGESKFTTWLYSIGINLARARFRKVKRYELMSEEDMDQLQPSFSRGRYSQSIDAWQPDELAARSETVGLVRRAIERLPEQYRVVVELRDIQEFSTDETADMLAMTPGAVRVRLHRARQALRALLDPYFAKPI